MPIQTACPHCKKMYNLADPFMGKTVKCQVCGSAFVVRATMGVLASSPAAVTTATQSKPAATPAGKPAGNPPAAGARPAYADYSRWGVDGPIVRKTTDIFGDSAAVVNVQHDPLGSHVVADPGFNAAAAALVTPKSDTQNLSVSKTVFENPYLPKPKKMNSAAVEAPQNQAEILHLARMHRAMIWALFFSFVFNLIPIAILLGILFIAGMTFTDIAHFQTVGTLLIQILMWVGILTILVGAVFSIIHLWYYYRTLSAIEHFKPGTGTTQFILVMVGLILIADLLLDSACRTVLRDAGLQPGFLGVKLPK